MCGRSLAGLTNKELHSTVAATNISSDVCCLENILLWQISTRANEKTLPTRSP